MKQITLVSATFGSLNVVVSENPNYANTFEIGNKRIDFSEILPTNMNIHKHDYHIIILDGVKAYVNIIVDTSEQYNGTINIHSPKHEEILAY